MHMFDFEGLDGSGKTTAINTIAERLRSAGLSVEIVKFPNYPGPVGGLVGQILRKEIDFPDPTARQLLMAADKHDFMKHRLPDVDVILLDRYSLSAFVYGELDGADICAVSAAHLELPSTAATFIMQVPTDVAFQRIQQTRKAELYECPDVMLQAHRLYRLYGRDAHAVFVDATQRPEEVVDFIWNEMQKHF